MNYVDLDFFNNEEQEKNNLLLKYKLDNDSIYEFRNKIKKVKVDKANNLGSELYNKIASKNYDDNNIDYIIELILNGANVNYKEDKKGNFPLLICSMKNYFNTFCLLLRANADVNLVNNYITTSVMKCARHGNVEMLKLLILFKADINTRCLDGDTALMSAKRHGQVDCAKILIENNAHLNNFNSCNESILDINVKENIKPTNDTFDILSLDDLETQEELKKYDLDIENVKDYRKRIVKASEYEINEKQTEYFDGDNIYIDDWILASQQINEYIKMGADVNYINKKNESVLTSVLYTLQKSFINYSKKLPNHETYFKDNIIRYGIYTVINLIKAGANINYQNINTDNDKIKNSLRIVFDSCIVQSKYFIGGIDFCYLLKILFLLKIKVTEEDIKYFKEEKTLSDVDKKNWQSLYNILLNYYENQEKEINPNSKVIIDKMISKNLIDASNVKNVYNSVSEVDLIEEATRKLNAIKNNEVISDEEEEKPKTRQFRKVY